MFKQITKKYIAIVVMALTVFVILPTTSHASGTPSHLSYQGKLTDTGGNPLGGGGTTYYFKFSLYDASSGGTKVWPSTAPSSIPLNVKQGSFNVLIGDTVNGYPDTLDYDFNSNNPVYLQIEVSSDNNTFETLTPRSQLSSTAFSKVSESVHGTSDSSFGTTTGFADTLVSMLSTAVNKAVLTIKGAAGQVANLFNILDSNDNSLFTVTSSGNVGVGTSTPVSKLSLGSGQIEVPVGSVSAPAYSFSGKLSTGLFVDASNNIQIANSGINNFSFNSSGNLILNTGRLILSSNGSAVAPTFTFISSPDSGMYRIPGSSNIGFATAGVARLNIDATGNVGIGTTTPISRLTVVGTSTITGPLFISNPTDLGSTANPLIQFPDGISSYGSSGIYVSSTGSSQNLIFKAGNGTPLSLSNTYVSVTASVGLSNRDGSAATPSYTFSGDNNTGIFRPTADTFGFSTNGTERMRIDASGNVGIGTTNPSGKLAVAGSGGTNLIIDNTTSGSAGLCLDGNGGQCTGADYLNITQAYSGFTTINNTKADSSMNFQIGGTTKMAIGATYASLGSNTLYVDTNTNFVGIGATNPYDRLEVSSSTAGGLGGRLVISNRAARTDGNTAELGFKVNSNFAATYYSALISALQEPGATDNSSLAFYTYNSGAARGTEKMRITSGGNIGIGTTNPTSVFGRNIQVTGAGSAAMTLDNGGKKYSFGVTGTNSLGFYDETLSAYRMSIDSTGNVGIATTTPGSLLTLGSGRIEVPIGTAAAPSVVFSGSTNAGLYTSVVGAFGISTGGTERILISAAGNIFMNNAGAIRGPDGTATNPGYSFGLSAPGTGMFRPSGQQIGFSINSAEKVRIDASGNVGIGTTSPSSLLHLYGSGTLLEIGNNTLTSTRINIQSGRAYFGGYFDGVNDHAEIGANGGKGIRFYVNGNTFASGGAAMTILPSGFVGIGTTSPAFPLDVYSTVSSNQTYGYLNSSGLVGTSAGTNSYSIRAQGRILAQEFNAVSDARLKNVQFDLGSDIALDAIKKLKPVSFTWKDSSNGQPVLGFLAQDVELIIPNAVSKVKGAFFDDQRTLDYNQIVAVLVGAVKEIANKIEGFKDEFRTNKLCVGDTCITEDQLKVLLENQNIQSGTPTPQTGAVEHASSTDSSDGSISTGTTSSKTVDNSVGDSNGSGDSGSSSNESASTPEPTQSESTQSVEQSSASNSDTSTSQPESISSDSSGGSGESISVE